MTRPLWTDMDKAISLQLPDAIGRSGHRLDEVIDNPTLNDLPELPHIGFGQPYNEEAYRIGYAVRETLYYFAKYGAHRANLLHEQALKSAQLARSSIEIVRTRKRAWYE